MSGECVPFSYREYCIRMLQNRTPVHRIVLVALAQAMGWRSTVIDGPLLQDWRCHHDEDLRHTDIILFRTEKHHYVGTGKWCEML